MSDLFVVPVTPTQVIQPIGLGTTGDTNAVLLILAAGLGLIALAVVGMYMMKMMKWA
jgi:hypothetical protein